MARWSFNFSELLSLFVFTPFIHEGLKLYRRRRRFAVKRSIFRVPSTTRFPLTRAWLYFRCFQSLLRASGAGTARQRTVTHFFLFVSKNVSIANRQLRARTHSRLARDCVKLLILLWVSSVLTAVADYHNENASKSDRARQDFIVSHRWAGLERVSVFVHAVGVFARVFPAPHI